MKTIEQLEQEFKAFTDQTKTQLETQKKEFGLQIESAKKDADQWKTVAEAALETSKKFEAQAKKAEEDKKAALSASKKAELLAFFEQSVKDGRLTPAMRDIAVKFAESLNHEAEVVKFEQKDGSSVSHTQFSLFKVFVGMIGKAKAFSLEQRTPRSGSQKELPAAVASEDNEHQEFAEVIHGGTKKTLPTQDADLAAKAFEYQDEQSKLGRSVSYGDALIHISKEMKNAA